jgi:hypothetical protein
MPSTARTGAQCRTLSAFTHAAGHRRPVKSRRRISHGLSRSRADPALRPDRRGGSRTVLEMVVVGRCTVGRQQGIDRPDQAIAILLLRAGAHRLDRFSRRRADPALRSDRCCGWTCAGVPVRRAFLAGAGYAAFFFTADFFRFAHEAFITSDIRFLNCSSSDGAALPSRFVPSVLLALIAAHRRFAASAIAFRPAALTPALLPRRHVRGSDAGLAMVAGGCGGAATPRH